MMKWFGITGSWRYTNATVESDVRSTVRKIMLRNHGIVTGGALGVDFFATDEALRHNPDASRIKVCLPATLERYAAHFRKRADERVITHAQAEMLIAQLTHLKATNPNALIEHPTNTVIGAKTYHERNTLIVELSDKVVGFRVNNSTGTGDTLKKARRMGKEVFTKEYVIH